MVEVGSAGTSRFLWYVACCSCFIACFVICVGVCLLVNSVDLVLICYDLLVGFGLYGYYCLILLCLLYCLIAVVVCLI